MNYPMFAATCKFTGCRNVKRDNGGYCNAHVYQQQKHGEMKPLKFRRKNGAPAAEADADRWIAEVRARKART